MRVDDNRVDFRTLIGECIEEIDKFILSFREYVENNDWHSWQSSQIGRTEGDFQLNMQNKIIKLEEKVVLHKKRFKAFQERDTRKTFVEIDGSLKTYSILLDRLKEHLSDETNHWMMFVSRIKNDPLFQENDNWEELLIDVINESHAIAKFQIDFMLKIDSAIDSLETYYGVEVDERDTIKMRGGGDANPMTEYYLKNKKFV